MLTPLWGVILIALGLLGFVTIYVANLQPHQEIDRYIITLSALLLIFTGLNATRW